jgi:hypothetical protein
MTKNEFEGLDEEEAPAQEFSEGVNGKQESPIASSNRGITYDYNSAPDTVKAPPRIDLDGKTVTIKKADMIFPPLESKWEWTRNKSKEFKYCMFVLYYDIAGQQEFIPGVRTFKRMEGTAIKYSHPSIPRDRQSQASQLLGLYSDFRKKDINEVTIKEFLSFLNSSPKALIKVQKVTNPKTKEEVKKNLIEKFVA